MVQLHPSCCDPEEPSLRVILHDRLDNIALIPTIKEDIIAAQRTLEWVISDKDWNHEKLNASDKMSMEFCCSKTVSWFQRISSFIIRSWTRPTAHGIPFIWEPIRCTKI
jgi:hypothetical protein